MSVKIALDAGHGLKTPGKQTPNGVKEWTLNDKVRDRVVKLLADYDVEIIHTDGDEGNVDDKLVDRLAKYKKAGVAAFVSIHHNAYTGDWGNATGVEVFTDNGPTKKDKELADAIYTRLVKYTGLKGRGVKQCDFLVINQDTIPAVLVEGGFMDGTNDYKVITSSKGQQNYAKAVAEGLIDFLNLKKKEVKKDKVEQPKATKTETTKTETTKTETTKTDDIKVKVDISHLNIRKGPGTNYAKTGKYTGVGVFTITEKKSGTGSKKGWGKLKSGAGWISLDYTTEVE